MNADLFRKLAALGLSTDQIAGVLEIMDTEAEDRKEKGRARTRRWTERLGLSRSEWISLSLSVIARDNETCQYCGSTLPPFHCDHVIPLSQGGTNDPSNLVAACRECNCGKGGRTPQQWRGGRS